MSHLYINCPICFQNIPENDMLDVGKCHHKIFKRCVVKYLTGKLQTRYKCPVQKCASNVADPIIRKCLSNFEIDAYENMCVRGGSSKARKCPMEGCPFIYVYVEEIGIFSCFFCESSICIKCNDIHHHSECGKTTMNKDSLIKKATEVIKEKKRLETFGNDISKDIYPNPNHFECTICMEFFLPRNGVILRNCLHCFCEDCLKGTLSEINFTSQFRCQICKSKLQDREVNAFIREKRFSSMKLRESKYQFYNCLTADCGGIWDYVAGTSSYKCPDCHNINCMECNDIHPKMSCGEFKKTGKYRENLKKLKMPKNQDFVNCFICKRLAIKWGGCNSIHCTNCGNDTCALTGKLAGCHDIKRCGCQGSDKCKSRNNYCKCSLMYPCHKDCNVGCFVENDIY